MGLKFNGKSWVTDQVETKNPELESKAITADELNAIAGVLLDQAKNLRDQADQHGSRAAGLRNQLKNLEDAAKEQDSKADELRAQANLHENRAAALKAKAKEHKEEIKVALKPKEEAPAPALKEEFQPCPIVTPSGDTWDGKRWIKVAGKDIPAKEVPANA